ncbi:MmgE/PrpD family protein [soil metagenome]
MKEPGAAGTAANRSSGAGESLSLQIARRIVALQVDTIPPAVRTTVCTSVVDQVGVMLAASGIGEGIDPFVALARDVPGRSTVIGHGFSSSAAQAAMANGAMAHALDYEDTHDATLVHPHAATVAAGLALAEATDASGADLVAAIVAGADIACRIGLAFDGDPEGVPGISLLPMISAFGATATAARMLRLTPEQCVQAFAIAQPRAVVGDGYKRYPPSHFRAVRDGFNAEAGVTAALLARNGMEMAGDPIGDYLSLYASTPNIERLLADLGTRFESADVSLKPWPCCRGTHAFVEAALDLATPASDIVGIDIDVSRFFAELCGRPEPRTAIAGKFDIPFTIGTTISHGRMGFANFEPSALTDPETLRLARLVRHTIDPSLDPTAGRLRLHLADGRTLERFVAYPKGHPQSPMTPEEISTKFADCAQRARTPVDPGRMNDFTAAFAQLDTLEHIKGLLP